MTDGEIIIAVLVVAMMVLEVTTYRQKRNMIRIQDETRQGIHDVRDHLQVIKGWSVRLDQIFERVKEHAVKTSEVAAAAAEAATGKIGEVAAAAVEQIKVVAESKASPA